MAASARPIVAPASRPSPTPLRASTRPPMIWPPIMTGTAALKTVGRRCVTAAANPAGGDGGGDNKMVANKVVGAGGVGIDYLASLASFPKPDDKLRTEALQIQGGGNAGNALTAAARLGMKPLLLSKVGDDPMGDVVMRELEDDGVDTSGVIRAAGHPTPFTYIIVDREGGTRTCIHTPGDPFDLMNYPRKNWINAELVYFDGRLTEGALLLAERAKEMGKPMLVEAERLRPNLTELLMFADYVTTSSNFPHDWTGEKDIGDAMIAVLSRLPNARFLVTTLGTRGSVMLTPYDAEEGEELPEVVLQDYLDDAFAQVESEVALKRDTAPVDVVASGDVPIRSGAQMSSPGPMRLKLKRDLSDDEAAKQGATQAARRAARNNADSGNHEGYVGVDGELTINQSLAATVTVSSAAILNKDAVLDTTGAGDAFNGSLIYALVTDMSSEAMLRLASLVAAANCTALGARQGLPRREALREGLL